MDLVKISNELADKFLEKKRNDHNKPGWCKIKFTEMQIIIITDLTISHDEASRLTGKSKPSIYAWRRRNIPEQYLRVAFGTRSYLKEAKHNSIINDPTIPTSEASRLTGLSLTQVHYRRKKIKNCEFQEILSTTKGKHRSEISYENMSAENNWKPYTTSEIELILSGKYNNKELCMMLGRTTRSTINEARRRYTEKRKRGEI